VLERCARLFLILAAAGLAACANPMSAPPSNEILGPEAAWREVSRAGRLFAEGVVAAPDGTLYVSDLTRTAVIRENNPGGTIYRVEPVSGRATVFLQPSGMSNGLHVDRRGDLLIAQDADTGGRALLRYEFAAQRLSLVADGFEGRRFNGVNDVTSDRSGRLYFTDGKYAGDEAVELPNAIYRADTDGTVTRLSSEILRPNGIEVSPDGRWLYVSASNNRRLPTNPLGPAADAYGIVTGGVVAYDLDASGNVSHGRLIYRDDTLNADGMAMDSDGNLYVALHNGSASAPRADIVVISPQGQVIAHLPTPGVGITTNLGFGRGADRHSLYVTVALPWRVYRIRTVRSGYFN
jgi:gluconolactonase